MDKIILKGICVQTIIGWYEWERAALSKISLDLTIGLPGTHASYSDNLSDTIDYESLINQLHQSLIEQRFFLIEALAEYVAQFVLKEFGASWVQVKLIKPVSMRTPVESIGIEIERSKP